MAAVGMMAVGVMIGSAVTPDAAHAGAEEEAREAFQQGRELYKAGEYAKAAEALARAYELKPHPALLRYLGQTYYKMNKAQLAIKAFKRYLNDAPDAPDREQILGRVRELEMVVGADDDDQPHAPPPTPASAPVPTPAPAAGTVPPDRADAPTGEDHEVPDTLGHSPVRTTEEAAGTDSTSMTRVMKWVTLGVGIGGLAAGAVFVGLGAGKASELEQAVVDSNPDKSDPQVAYSREHHDLQEAYKRNRTASIVSFIVGGVAAAASATLFIVDRNPSGERSAKVQVSPIIGGVYGAAAEVRF